MKCDKCIAEGTTSKVYPRNGPTTMLACPKFYDEAGVLHDHDGNYGGASYRCSNGHSWHYVRRCPVDSCEWNNDRPPGPQFDE